MSDAEKVVVTIHYSEWWPVPDLEDGDEDGEGVELPKTLVDEFREAKAKFLKLWSDVGKLVDLDG